MEKSRVFRPEAEKSFGNEDYQCEYYRGSYHRW